MATIQDINQTENQNQGNVGTQPVSGTSAPSGATGTSQGGQGAAGAASSPVQQNINPQQGPGFTDVSAYLNANPQGGQQIANQAATNLTNQYNTTKAGIDTSSQNFQNASNQGYVPANTDLISQVSSNPVAAASNPANITAFQGQLNDQYSGPTSWADLGTQQGKVAQAQQSANLINTPGGENVLTQQVENQLNPGQASGGVNALDTLLLGGSPGAYNTISNAAKPFSTLPDYLNSLNTQNQALVGQNQANASQAQQAAQGALNTGVTNLNQAITQGAQTAEQQRQAYNQQVNNLYSQAVPVEQQINAWLGELPNNAGANVPDIIAQAMKQNQPITQTISPTNFATPDQYATAQALQQLAGTNPLNLPINQATLNQAGTAPTVPTSNTSLQQLLQQYEPSLAGAYQTALGANPSGFNYQPTQSLLQSLNKLDPSNYLYNNANGNPIFGFQQ